MAEYIARQRSRRTFQQSESPLVIPHETFVGLGIESSDARATAAVSVAVDGSRSGAFVDGVTLEGTGKWHWPDTDGSNRLYHAAYIQITWASGTIDVLQKG